MTGAERKRAIQSRRANGPQRDTTRFQVQARDADRELILALARRLSEDGPEALQARTAVQQIVSGKPPRQGGIVDALRRSPLVGADLNLRRTSEDGRVVDL